MFLRGHDRERRLIVSVSMERCLGCRPRIGKSLSNRANGTTTNCTSVLHFGKHRAIPSPSPKEEYQPRLETFQLIEGHWLHCEPQTTRPNSRDFQDCGIFGHRYCRQKRDGTRYVLRRTGGRSWPPDMQSSSPAAQQDTKPTNTNRPPIIMSAQNLLRRRPRGARERASLSLPSLRSRMGGN